MATLTIAAQEKKYQSLLWEISGNGLAKKSYLYGSMHVSDKVSYNLSDAFFDHLLNADMVAGESDPATWPAFTDILNADGKRNYQQSFYSSFYISPLTKDGLLPLFSSNSYTLNGILTRTNERRQENQEETYLDMFIYRTGKKYKKQSIALEDTKKSLLTLANIDTRDMAFPEMNRVALQKILKNIPVQEAFSNFYREKDLDMMDTLAVLTSPEPYLKALLYDRNVIMVKSIDSLVKKGSLFAAVGAAHLPGKKGIIESLRKLGYTVNPVHSAYTEKGITTKQKIETYFTKPVYKQYTTSDGMVSLPLFDLIMENRQGAESPDLTNGGYTTLKRLTLSDFVKKDNKAFDPQTLDSLFYENIKGRILDKKTYTYNDYKVYDIKSTTKTGNAQHYRYYITPLEVIAVIMSGDRDYVRRFEDDVFNNITVKAVNTGWSMAEPKGKGFKAEMPAYRIAYGDINMAKPENIDLYAGNSHSNYFLLERTLQDNNYLEESGFELKRMHYEFYKKLNTDSTQTKYIEGQHPSFTSAGSVGSKTIRLKSVLNGGKYYLLGTVGTPEKDTERFFNSFTLKPVDNAFENFTYTDSIDNYTIVLPKKQNEKLEFTNRKPKKKKDAKINLYVKQNTYNSFVMPSGITIDYKSNIGSRYLEEKSMDSIYANAKKTDLLYYSDTENNTDEQDYETNEIVNIAINGKSGITNTQWNKVISKGNNNTGKAAITSETKYRANSNQGYTFDYIITKENSNQAIKKRYYYHNNVLYSLSAIVPAQNEADKYLDQAFDSFTFLPSEENKKTLEKDKVKLFIEDAQNPADSLRYSAMSSVYYLDIKEKDLPSLIAFYKSFTFKTDENDAQSSLLQNIGSINNASSRDFLEEQYKKEDVTATMQFAILSSLADQKSKESYKKILELMEYDLPLIDDQYSVASLFTTFKEDTENSTVMFPDIFQFYSIKEYHGHIINFAAKMLDDKAIKPSKIKSFKKMLLTNAKLELKREKNRKSEETEEYAVYEEDDEAYSNPLASFIEVLYPFKKEKTIAAFFNDVKALNSKDINLEIARLDAVNGNYTEMLDTLLTSPETLFKVYNIANVKNDVPAARKITADLLAQSAIYTANNLKVADSVTFINKRIVPVEKQKATFYFYTIERTTEEPMDKGLKQLAGVAFINNSDGTINTLAYKFINPTELLDDDKTEEIIAADIDRILNSDRPRTNSDFNDINKGLFYGDYNFDD